MDWADFHCLSPCLSCDVYVFSPPLPLLDRRLKIAVDSSFSSQIPPRGRRTHWSRRNEACGELEDLCNSPLPHSHCLFFLVPLPDRDL
ncbi:hypothetical protein PFISCL1PPCAC_1444 [Pristionchus fissidentatus]|uniref:Uncharacterized protein n=1 Tax=Pristionchus fissidentatus TaxID=1538716 RepID=A0AAV5USM7_9BILA|nr:hypothetical protein PFISCL1PPCAC_1444 [Pristionchus fissidentatus]